LPRLLFVDDHPLYGAGVRLTLEAALPELEILLARTGAEAITLLSSGLDVDLVLTDLRLEGSNGFELLERIGRLWPMVARGILCADLTAEIARGARAVGCVACLSKARDMDGLVEALDALFNGDEVFDAEAELSIGLSKRRQMVLAFAARGLSNKEIARQLGITERTVKDHWSCIFAQMDVSNRAEAVSRAHELRLI